MVGGGSAGGAAVAVLVAWSDPEESAELAHVVGLDHVHAPGELMQPTGDESVTSWGDGDRTGLAALGRGACVDY